MIENNIAGNSDDTQTVQVGAGALSLAGLLHIPAQAHGVVLLAQGSKHVESMNYVSSMAEAFHGAGLATLSVHLLTEDEEALDNETQFFRYNSGILSQRIIGIADWLAEMPATQNFVIGYFGTGSTGAAACNAAAERPDIVHAVVTANGRIDLAQSALERVLTAVLLIAAEDNTGMVDMNREALEHIQTPIAANKRLETIAGDASMNMLDTPEMLHKVIELAGQWFSCHLVPIV
ncbi:MAG: dienelactone hydrolase family protein [Ktedonobacteraceae bacterium]